MKLPRVKRLPPPQPASSFWVEYSKERGQVVGTIFDRRTQRALFTIRGSDEYTRRTARGMLDGLGGAERGERLAAFYCGANDNHETGNVSLGGWS